MLNRTNRTLSAHLNRLNLGTRTLASQASFINGDSTLHTRHVYPVAVRAGPDRLRDRAVVLVDDRSLEVLGRWPLSRRLYAKAVARLDRAGTCFHVLPGSWFFPRSAGSVSRNLASGGLAPLCPERGQLD